MASKTPIIESITEQLENITKAQNTPYEEQQNISKYGNMTEEDRLKLKKWELRLGKTASIYKNKEYDTFRFNFNVALNKEEDLEVIAQLLEFQKTKRYSFTETLILAAKQGLKKLKK